MAVTIKIYWYELSRHERFLNFAANKGISDMSRYDITTETIIINAGLRIIFPKPKTSFCKISGSDAMKMELDGVGKPRNESDCLVSILNFANRRAELIVMMNGRNNTGLDRKEIACTGSPFAKSATIINPGTTPNVITSARESSCFPFGE